MRDIPYWVQEVVEAALRKKVKSALGALQELAGISFRLSKGLNAVLSDDMAAREKGSGLPLYSFASLLLHENLFFSYANDLKLLEANRAARVWLWRSWESHMTLAKPSNN